MRRGMSLTVVVRDYFSCMRGCTDGSVIGMHVVVDIGPCIVRYHSVLCGNSLDPTTSPPKNTFVPVQSNSDIIYRNA